MADFVPARSSRLHLRLMLAAIFLFFRTCWGDLFTSTPSKRLAIFFNTLAYAAAMVTSALFLSLTIGRSLYDPAELLEVKSQIHSVAVTWIGVFLFFGGVVFTLKIGADFSRGAELSFCSCGSWHLGHSAHILVLVLACAAWPAKKFLGRDAVLIFWRNAQLLGLSPP